MKLRPRARIIRTIGDQLISGPEAAIIELVKNSYDADSPFILIRIVPKVLGDTIIVSDNGHGMSQQDIIGKWFEPATDEKYQRKTSPNGRPMLGAKGIGRFAASRLGRFTKLDSVCKENGFREYVTVEIDWEWFDSAKYLDEVDIDIHKKLALNKTTGVTLTISELKDLWTKKRLETLIRELKRVASPTEYGFSIRLDISTFTEKNSGFDGQSLLETLNFNEVSTELSDTKSDPFLIKPFNFQGHSDYLLKGEFDRDGTFRGEFSIERGDNLLQTIDIPALKMTEEESSCGPFSISINIYDREKEAIENLFNRMGINFSHIGIQTARKVLSENAGISIFRKGFRVRPYGAPDFDWLELERQRVQDPSKKLGLSQVSGFLEIQDESVSNLLERSSREGLEHNGAFERLNRLVRNVLIHAEERRFQFREKAGLSRKIKGDLSKVKDTATLKNISKAVRSLPLEYRDKIESAILKDTSNLAIELSEIDEYQQILESRSALGLVVAEVIHEGRRLLNPVISSAKALIDGKELAFVKSASGDVYRAQFPDNAQTIHDGVKGLGSLLKKLDPISGRKRGRPTTFNILKIIDRCIDLLKDGIGQNEVQIFTNCDKSLSAYGYEADLQAVILNIIDNAIHWLSTVDIKRHINIDCSESDNWVVIGIDNNGPLIDDNYSSRLFDVGFTLKSEGTGLGLAISRETIRRSKGELYFDEASSVTRFIIKMPKGN